jgi:hypothetical protein
MSGFEVHPVPFRLSPLGARLLVAVIAAAGFVLVVVLAGPAAAQEEPVPTPTSPLVITESDADPAVEPGSPVGRIIPQPNSGARPERPGDRGGSLQLGLFALLLTFMGVAAWRIAVSGRSGRQAYAARAAGDGNPTGGDVETDADEASAVATGGPEPSPRDG